ncbi:hypothetical protein QQF64_003674 [Cirrhinus molitorella]|uniref:Uncharacterized protein n=1 Tax=Cirrhinus molitorella TaxID=172907 RepID=A0ABR3MLZ8_9TELE
MCKLHPAVAACVKLCCHDDTPARLAQGRSGGDDELDVPGDGVCAICTHTRKEALCSALSSDFSTFRSCFPVAAEKSGEKEGGKRLTRFKE